MRTSDTTVKLIAAVIAARRVFAPVVKDTKGQIGQNREYKYADLAGGGPGPRDGGRSPGTRGPVGVLTTAAGGRGYRRTSHQKGQCTMAIPNRELPEALSHGMTYLHAMPATIPPGRRLVHNNVKPTRNLGMRGFRAWFASAHWDRLEVCDCGWAPELGPHFRIRRADPI